MGGKDQEDLRAPEGCRGHRTLRAKPTRGRTSEPWRTARAYRAKAPQGVGRQEGMEQVGV